MDSCSVPLTAQKRRRMSPQTKHREKVKKQKRLREEDTPTQKPGSKRKRTQEKLSQDELSENNLRIWEKMDEAACNTCPRTIKQFSSRRSVAFDAAQEKGRSQRSSSNLALYHFTYLVNVEVYIDVEP
ncbi:hypothetical protein B7494_g3485 [Chlorociboria aeruginascens]|nr:hypothetical protein B7494_g3485 [Chlorociboria aeruginascens]